MILAIWFNPETMWPNVAEGLLIGICIIIAAWVGPIVFVREIKNTMKKKGS